MENGQSCQFSALSFACQKGWTRSKAGVGPPGGEGDAHSRYLEAAAAHGVIIGCLYLPNGNPQPGPKFDYKLDWSAARGFAVGVAASASNSPSPRVKFLMDSTCERKTGSPDPGAEKSAGN
jgi:exonuclease III